MPPRKTAVCACGKPMWTGSRTCLACRPGEICVPPSRRLVVGGMCKYKHVLEGDNLCYDSKGRPRCVTCRNRTNAARVEAVRNHRAPEKPKAVAPVRVVNTQYEIERAAAAARRAARVAAVHERVQEILRPKWTYKEYLSYMNPREDAA